MKNKSYKISVKWLILVLLVGGGVKLIAFITLVIGIQGGYVKPILLKYIYFIYVYFGILICVIPLLLSLLKRSVKSIYGAVLGAILLLIWTLFQVKVIPNSELVSVDDNMVQVISYEKLPREIKDTLENYNWIEDKTIIDLSNSYKADIRNINQQSSLHQIIDKGIGSYAVQGDRWYKLCSYDCDYPIILLNQDIYFPQKANETAVIEGNFRLFMKVTLPPMSEE